MPTRNTICGNTGRLSSSLLLSYHDFLRYNNPVSVYLEASPIARVIPMTSPHLARIWVSGFFAYSIILPHLYVLVNEKSLFCLNYVPPKHTITEKSKRNFN